MKKKQIASTESQKDEALRNIVTPMGLAFERARLTLGELIGRCYGVIKYPLKVSKGWLRDLVSLPNTIVSIHYQPERSGALVKAIAHQVRMERSLSESAKDPLERQRSERAAVDGETLLQRMDQENEVMGTMDLMLMPLAHTEKEFEMACSRVENRIAMLGGSARVTANLQKESFQHMMPYHPPTEKMSKVLGRVMPLSTLLGGFPFSETGFNDGEGSYFGTDASGGIVVLDPWKREGERTNSNFLVMGKSGVGKTHAVKHLILSEFMHGTKVIIIDPEREYRDLTRALGGAWVNAAGSGGRINPFQVRPAPEGEDEDALNPLARHLKTLEIFLTLYLPELSSIENAALMSAMLELYESFGITWETEFTGKLPHHFPTFGSLYELLSEKVSKDPGNEVFASLKALIHEAAVGSDHFLWNGTTSIEMKENILCLDTNELQMMKPSLRSAQYFNLLTYAWEIIERDRTERVMVVCDEAYLMIDERVPEALIFLRNAAKRIRKYEGALAIISHSVIDFLAEPIRQHGQALLDLPTYKVLMGTDGENLRQITEIFHLTDSEQELLAQQKRAESLFIAGSKRLKVTFEIPDYKLKLMGDAGGR